MEGFPSIQPNFINLGVTTEHVAKFIDEQPSDLDIEGGPKNLAQFFLYALTLPNINQFS